jgi:hypothetical protein
MSVPTSEPQTGKDSLLYHNQTPASQQLQRQQMCRGRGVPSEVRQGEECNQCISKICQHLVSIDATNAETGQQKIM